jgi:hypothetical protein
MPIREQRVWVSGRPTNSSITASFVFTISGYLVDVP